MAQDTFVYIGFSKPIKWKIGAAAISWWTDRPYSHVYVRFVSSDPQIPSNVYHAAHGMVHFRAFENFLLDNKVIKEYKIPMSAQTRKRTLIHCMKINGEGYGYSELGKIFISDIAYSCFQKQIHFKNGKGYICSELVGKLMTEELGHTFNKPLNLLKPSHIEDKLKELKYEESNEHC